MHATFRYDNCLFFQSFYIYDGQPCKTCPQGKIIAAGIFDDSDIEKIEKICNSENIFIENENTVV